MTTNKLQQPLHEKQCKSTWPWNLHSLENCKWLCSYRQSVDIVFVVQQWPELTMETVFWRCLLHLWINSCHIHWQCYILLLRILKFHSGTALQLLLFPCFQTEYVLWQYLLGHLRATFPAKKKKKKIQLWFSENLAIESWPKNRVGMVRFFFGLANCNGILSSLHTSVRSIQEMCKCLTGMR